MNWYGYDWPVWDITKNPPLACYYLAAAGTLFGWSETSLHAAFLRKQPVKEWLGWLALPILALVAYQIITRAEREVRA